MKDKRPILGYVAAGAAFVILVAGLLIASHFMDRKLNESALTEDDYKLEQAEYSYKRGTLDLYRKYYDYYHNFENFLIMGTDGTGNDASGEDYHNDMADFLLLMSIDKTDNSFSLLELNRDTIMDVPIDAENGDKDLTATEQLCIAHWYGKTPEQGSLNQVRAVSILLGGLPISGYYALDMEDIPKLNQAIGGVTVTMQYDFSELDPAMSKGTTLTLSDKQAYLYLRSRMNVGAGTNEERMDRQHTYLEGFLSQSLEKISSQPRYYYALFDSLMEIADTNLTGKQISRIAKALTVNTRKGLFQFEGKNKTGYILDDGIEHMEFYPDKKSVVDVMTDIFQLKEGDSGPGWDRDEWIREWKEYDWRSQTIEDDEEDDEDLGFEVIED